MSRDYHIKRAQLYTRSNHGNARNTMIQEVLYDTFAGDIDRYISTGMYQWNHIVFSSRALGRKLTTSRYAMYSPLKGFDKI